MAEAAWMKVPRLDAATGAITWSYEPASDQLSSLARPPPPPPPPPAEHSMPPHHGGAHASWQLQQEHMHVMPPVQEQHAIQQYHEDVYPTCQQSPWQNLVPAAPPPPPYTPPHPPRDRVVVNLTPDAKPKPPKDAAGRVQCHREIRWICAAIVVVALLLAVWATLVLLEVMPLPWATGGDSGSSDAPSPPAPPAAPPGQL